MTENTTKMWQLNSAEGRGLWLTLAEFESRTKEGRGCRGFEREMEK